MISNKTITLNDGTSIEASAPMIISASRATDIPAFFAEWLINSFERGYVFRINPFNGKRYCISLSSCKFIVFWSKNYLPLMEHLKYFEKRNIQFYFQFTLNDYEKENFEPCIPDLSARIETLKSLARQYGQETISWRFDPLILTDAISPDVLIEKIVRVYNEISGFTDSLVISFADIEKYAKVKKNMKLHGINYKEWSENDVFYFSEKLSLNFKNTNLQIYACAEKYNLEKYGILPSSCIDAERIKKLSNDSELLKTLNNSCRIDKGQRQFCRCVESKDIGNYNTCGHFCIYCYANNSEKIVSKNLAKFSNDSESLCF